MSDIVDIIINAIDQASDVFNDVSSNASDSMETVSSTADGASQSIDTITESTSSVSDTLDNVDGSTLDDVASSADSASNSVENIDGSSLDDVASSADGASGGLDDVASSAESSLDALVQLQSVQILADFGSQAEDAAQGFNEMGISVGQLSKNTDIAEPKMKEMLNHITNATFPHDEAIAYTNLLNQMGITGVDALGDSASAMDVLNDATGVGADNVMKLGSSFNVMGVDMTNIESSYNAVAYAQDNVIGGVESYVGWMTKYDAEFANMGLNIDQTAVLIAAATQKFGGGRAAYTGLNEAIKETNGDLQGLEKALGMQPGALANAEEATAQYSGKIEDLAAEEAEHKTWLDEIGAAYDDFSLSVGDTMAPLNNMLGAFGGVMSVMPALASAQMLYNSLKGGEAAADNISFLGKIRNTGATVAETVAKGVNAVATGAVTAATWLWNAALNANPIGIVVIAIVALIAILWHLYNTNEDVRKAVDFVWNALQEVGQIIMDVLMGALTSLWDILSQVGTFLISVFKPVWDSIVNVFMIVWKHVQYIIDIFQQMWEGQISLSDGLGMIWSVIESLFLSVFGEIINAVVEWASSLWDNASEAGQGFLDTLIEFFTELPGQIWEWLVNALTTLGEWELELINWVIEAGSEFLSNMVDWLSELPETIWEWLVNALTTLGDWELEVINWVLETGAEFLDNMVQWLSELPDTIWEWLVNALTTLGEWELELIDWVINTGSEFLSNFISYISQLPGQIWEWLVETIQKLLDFGKEGLSKAKTAGSNILKGVISFITRLPAQLWNNFLNALSKITSFASQGLSKAKTVGSNILKGIIDYVKQLPTKVWEELMRIGDNIMKAGGDLFNKAKDMGKKILDGALGALGIKSPGKLFYAIRDEMGRIITKISDTGSNAYEVSKELGKKILDGFGDIETDVDFNLMPNMENMENMPEADVSANFVSNPISEESLDELKNNADITENIVDKTGKRVMDTFKDMVYNVDKNLTNLVKKDRDSWSRIKTDTENNLRKINGIVDTATRNMTGAWTDMKKDIINAASDIRKKSKDHFDELGLNIKGFYGKLQNPSKWGAGPSNPPTPRSNSSGAGGLSSLLNSVTPIQMQSISFSQAESNSCIDSGCAEYKGLTGQKINIQDLIDSVCVNCGGSAGWLDVVRPNVNYIKDKSSNWSMKSPMIMNKYPTGLSFKVKDFLGSVPKFSFATFKGVAEALFNNISYDFYYDDEKHGSWIGALKVGLANCKHGTEALINLANAFGFYGSWEHGTTASGIGHYWANIAGHRMDTTNYTSNGSWAPLGAGSDPSSDPLSSQAEILSEIRDTNGKLFNIFTGEYVEREQTIVLKVESEDQNINISIPDLPDDIDENKLIAILKEAIKDKNFIDTLTKDQRLVKNLLQVIESERRVKDSIRG